MGKILRLPDTLYAHIESYAGVSPDESPKIKVRIPLELIDRVNDIINLFNELSENKIIRSAMALSKEEKNNG